MEGGEGEGEGEEWVGEGVNLHVVTMAVTCANEVASLQAHIGTFASLAP